MAEADVSNQVPSKTDTEMTGGDNSVSDRAAANGDSEKRSHQQGGGNRKRRKLTNDLT